MAEKNVAQTREVYDRSKDALDASIATFERTFDAAGQGAAAFNRKIVDIAKRNVNSVFDLAKSLASAKKLTDIVELQAVYWRRSHGRSFVHRPKTTTRITPTQRQCQERQREQR